MNIDLQGDLKTILPNFTSINNSEGFMSLQQKQTPVNMAKGEHSTAFFSNQMIMPNIKIGGRQDWDTL